MLPNNSRIKTCDLLNHTKNIWLFYQEFEGGARHSTTLYYFLQLSPSDHWLVDKEYF